MAPSPDYADQLRAADLRVTRPRLAVLEAVHAQPHADTESIFVGARRLQTGAPSLWSDWEMMRVGPFVLALESPLQCALGELCAAERASATRMVAASG